MFRKVSRRLRKGSVRVLQGSARILQFSARVLQRFRKVPEGSERFRKVPNGSARFRRGSKVCKVLRRFHEGSAVPCFGFSLTRLAFWGSNYLLKSRDCISRSRFGCSDALNL